MRFNTLPAGNVSPAGFLGGRLSQCPTPLCGVGHWGGGEKLGVKGQERFKNRLSYSTRTASAFLNCPQRPFHLRASPAKPATPVVFAVWSAHDLNFVRYAEKHCRFCCYKAKRFNPPRSLRRVAASEVRETVRTADSLVVICLRNTFSDVDTPLRVVSTLFFEMRSHISKQCPTPQSGVFIQKESG